MNSDKRNAARAKIREFFDEKREKFFEIEFLAIKRRFLAEINSLAKEMEFLVSDLVDKGKNIGFNFKHWMRTVYTARWALLIPFIILGGIYSGLFTPTESAAVAVMTTIIIGLFQGTLKLQVKPVAVPLVGVIDDESIYH